MAARKGRSPVATTVTQNSIEEASAALKELPEKPKVHWSLREAIYQLQGTINTALERGYSYQEVANMLGEQGIRISPASLRSYLAASNRDSETTTPKRRRSSTKTISVEDESKVEPAASEPETEVETDAAPPTETESESAPKKSPRTRRTASRTSSQPKTSGTSRRKKSSAETATS